MNVARARLATLHSVHAPSNDMWNDVATKNDEKDKKTRFRRVRQLEKITKFSVDFTFAVPSLRSSKWHNKSEAMAKGEGKRDFLGRK